MTKPLLLVTPDRVTLCGNRMDLVPTPSGGCWVPRGFSLSRPERLVSPLTGALRLLKSIGRLSETNTLSTGAMTACGLLALGHIDLARLAGAKATLDGRFVKISNRVVILRVDGIEQEMDLWVDAGDRFANVIDRFLCQTTDGRIIFQATDW